MASNSQNHFLKSFFSSPFACRALNFFSLFFNLVNQKRGNGLDRNFFEPALANFKAEL